MVKNPAWKQSTDSLRHDYVTTIVDTLGVTSAETQLSDMQAGTQDVMSDTPINPASIPSADRVERFQLPHLAVVDHLPVHRVQPAQPGRERRRRANSWSARRSSTAWTRRPR